MAKSSECYYLDTNVISESFRTGCWSAISANFRLVTVRQVHQECATGGGHGIDIRKVVADTEAKGVTKPDIASLRLRLAGRVGLDAGEEHLLAAACLDKTAWKISSPDNASVRACHYLGLLDRHISLEEMLERVSHKPKTQLQKQYTKAWLSVKRTGLLLEG